MNPINESGKKLEIELRDFLREKGIPFQRSGEGSDVGIDFRIYIDDRTLWVECANQNVGGSVVEKIPHKVFKYWKKYGMDKIFLLRGAYNIFNEPLIDHLKLIEKTCNIEVEIVSIEQLKNILQGSTPKQHAFF